MGAFLSPCRLVPVTCRVIYGTASYRQGQKLSNAFINFPQDKKKKNVLPDSNGTQTPQSTSTRDYSGVKKKKKKKLSSTSYCPSYQTEGTSRSLWWGETSSTCEVKASSPCDDSWKEKQFQEGETGLCPRHAALPAHQNRFLGGTSWPFRGLTAWCRGHVHRLAHGIGNYAETQGWPEARYSAQHYWSELLTDIQSALKSLFTVQNVLSVLLSPPTPCSPFHAAAHTWISEWIWDESDSNYYTKHTLNTYLLTGGADLKRWLNTTQHTVRQHLESFTMS